MIRRFWLSAGKILCLAVGLFLLLPFTASLLPDEKHPDLTALPDYNYMMDVWTMLRESKYQGAKERCADIIRNDLPGSEEAKAVYKLCDAEVNGARQRICRVANGFVTGSGKSIEEAGGAIVSDLIIYGDVRDLIVQGYYKITGKETDLFVVTLSSIGLVTELACWADWMPSMLKAFHKAGAFTETFAHSILKAARKLARHGKPDLETRKLFTDFSTLVRTNSFPRSSYILRYVDTPNDLAIYANVASRAPSLPYLMLKSGGENGAALLRKYGSSDTGLRVLKLCARKGPAGIHWLRSYVPVRTVKWGAHITKILYLNHAYDFVYHAVRDSGKPIRILFGGVAALLILIGLSSICELRQIFRKRAPEPKETSSTP